MVINIIEIINLNDAINDLNAINNIIPTHKKSNSNIYHNESNIDSTASTILLLYEYSLIYIPKSSNYYLYLAIIFLYHGVNYYAPTSVISTPEYIPITNIDKSYGLGDV